MSHSAVLGHVEVPVTYSPQEAVGLMQETGVVGAGGGGFPTYVKYEATPQCLVVNGMESEPGFYADKLLLRDEPEALVDVFAWLKETFSMEVMILAVEEVARPYVADFERYAKRLRSFSIAYLPPKYQLGEEHALCKAIFGMSIPKKELPPAHGVVVNNNETLFNVYRAVFRERPVVTKFTHVYGEVGPVRVFEAPIGTLAVDLLELYGADPSDYVGCMLYDGGPVLCKRVEESMGKEPMAAVSPTTNAFLVVHPDRDRPRRKHYPSPDYEENRIDAPWAATEIENVQAQIERVRVPVGGRFQTGRLLVQEGDSVVEREAIKEPALTGVSVGAHASIEGTVTAVTKEYVEIQRE